MLSDLKLDHGTITLLERQTSSTFKVSETHSLDHLPARTVVQAVLHPAEGSNIRVEIWLPDPENWNGRLLGLGNGGAAGNINPAIFAGPVTEGYAVATTDMGTAPNADSGVDNPQVWKDFGFRATHLMTTTARQLIRALYGKDPDTSYFVGGSTGGQQALQEAQRYPDDYDGIVANIPAHCRTPLHAYFLWNFQILKRCPFTESQEKSVISAASQFMAPREVPLVAGKIVSDPRHSEQDVEEVIALAMQKAPTLTAAHAAALRKLLDGPRHAITGERIFDGIPMGCSFEAATGHLYLFNWAFGAKKDPMDIDFGKDVDAYTAALGPYLNAENADLTPFAKRGGKLIMISGSADQVVPYHATLDYYERVIDRVGSIDKVKFFFRYYIIPGMSHGSGPGVNNLPDWLKVVVSWREKGIAPERIQGKRIVDGKTEWELPIYPYPTKTGWSAEGRSFAPVDGPRGGVSHIAERFLPAAQE